MIEALRSRIRSIHPDHHAIAGGMVWVALFVFFAKLVGAAKEMAIAYLFGVSEVVDAYLFVVNLLSWPVAVWFSVLSVVLIPLAARQRHAFPAELTRFRAELLGLSVSIGLAGMAVAWLVLPALLQARWVGLAPATVGLATQMARPLAVLLPLGVLIGLLSVWMLASRRHANTLLEGVPALVILFVLLGLSGSGSAPLIWGTVVGYALHLLCLAILQARHRELELPKFSFRSGAWRTFWRGFGIMLIGQALISLTSIIDQIFAAHLGNGAIATLGYATRILALILALGATVISRATLPVFASAHAQQGTRPRSLVARWTWLMFASGTITMLIGWTLAPHIVGILFERGAFTAENTAAVSDVLRFSLFQLAFYFSAIVLVSDLASKARHGLIATIASAGLAAKVAANAMLVPILGINGIALATSVMYATTLLLLVLVRQKN